MKRSFSKTFKFSIAFLTTFAFLFTSLDASDWPHWLGPNGNNQVIPAPNFDPNLDNWDIAWKADVGLGYSTVTSTGGRAYTMGHDGNSKETIVCFSASSGDKIWEYSYNGALIPSMHVGGPNASITISGQRLYAVSKDGQVFCLDAASGNKIWHVQLTDILGIKVPKWGFGSSPVEYKGDILISAGKTVALDIKTGNPSWVSKKAYKAGYGTPVVFSRSGTDFIATVDSEGLSMLDASNGKEIARHKMRSKYTVISATPTVVNQGEQIYVFTDMQSELLSFDGQNLSSVWNDRKLRNSMSGSILIDGTLFGVNGNHKSKRTSLYSRNFDNGKEHWSVPNFGYASLIAIGDTLVILTEDGDLVTASANAKEYEEISRKKLLDAICWTNPTYANGQIFVRNEHGVLMALVNG